MEHDATLPSRRSIRLPGYDYTLAGAYFVTICTHERACLFGKIEGEEMLPSAAWQVVEKCWNDIPVHFPHVELDEFVIMPNHIHGILSIVDTPPVGTKNLSPVLKDPPPHPVPNPPKQRYGTTRTIGSVVRGFKIGVTKWFRSQTQIHSVWQRNYWEHIIRNEPELHRIREYIQNNPKQWTSDSLYTERL